MPKLYKTLLDTIPQSLTGLRVITLAGENFTEELVREHFDKLPMVEFYNEYGPTENSVCATIYQFHQDATKILIGKPIANVTCHISDRYGNVQPVGIAGELYISGVNLSRGYLNRPELTAEKFIPNSLSYTLGARLYTTGDICRYLPDGNIEYLGRLDHQVKIRGFRIELGEIETVLTMHPAIRESVVIARNDRFGTKQLAAYIVADRQQPCTVSELRAFLKEKLPDYMIPATFTRLDVFPLNPNGKIERRALPEPDTAGQGSHAYVAPRTPIETMLADIWAALLHRQPVGIHDNFFELGGHSLLAMQVMSRVKETFGVEIPVRSLFEVTNIAEFAQVIAAKQFEGVNRDDLERLLTETEGLSDEDAARLLHE